MLNGAGMRFLVRFRGVGAMTGVDATEVVVELGKKRCWAAGSERANPLRSWGRECHRTAGRRRGNFRPGARMPGCYVFDKARLISEAVRVVKPGGTIAFTDWINGTVPMSGTGVAGFLNFMSFPNVQDVVGYRGLLERAGCTVMTAEDTVRFAPYADLDLEMVDKQLTYDALSILDFNTDALGAIAAEMQFLAGPRARPQKLRKDDL